ncbi:hypothetical protein HY945_03760 [Candidatus Gottesmanbacteria bacterium]|nr:hypothetical protein [Candidatus Gottesmanbacteria bacterium]
MENPKKLTANYILSYLYQKEVMYFTTKMFSDLFGISKSKAHQSVFYLKQRDLIKEVEKGKYLVLGFEPHRVLSNPFFIASRIIYPSYISFRSALNHYGFTEQVPFTVYVATTKRKKEIQFGNYRYKYIALSPHKFFGYEKQMIGELPVLLAEKEKAIVDSLDQLQYAGGFEEVAKALFNAKNEIDNQKLMEYALKTENKTLCSRLGFLLEKYQMSMEGLKNSLSTSFVPLDPDKPKSKVWDKKWRLNVNITDDKLFTWRQT